MIFSKLLSVVDGEKNPAQKVLRIIYIMTYFTRNKSLSLVCETKQNLLTFSSSIKHSSDCPSYWASSFFSFSYTHWILCFYVKHDWISQESPLLTRDMYKLLKHPSCGVKRICYHGSSMEWTLTKSWLKDATTVTEETHHSFLNYHNYHHNYSTFCLSVRKNLRL